MTEGQSKGLRPTKLPSVLQGPKANSRPAHRCAATDRSPRQLQKHAEATGRRQLAQPRSRSVPCGEPSANIDGEYAAGCKPREPTQGCEPMTCIGGKDASILGAELPRSTSSSATATLGSCLLENPLEGRQVQSVLVDVWPSTVDKTPARAHVSCRTLRSADPFAGRTTIPVGLQRDAAVAGIRTLDHARCSSDGSGKDNERAAPRRKSEATPKKSRRERERESGCARVYGGDHHECGCCASGAIWP